MFAYESSLATLDSTWAEMRAARDADRMRYRLFCACTFAIMSVHTPASHAEWQFEQYMSTGVFPDGSMLDVSKSSSILVLTEWCDTVTFEDMDVDGWALADTIMRHVRGLGTVKASFASALCGNPEPYCLDTHGIQLVASRTGEKYSRILRSIRADKCLGSRAIDAAWKRYRAWGETTFGSRNHQWEFFALAVPEFRDAGHAIYFAEALLPMRLTAGAS